LFNELRRTELHLVDAALEEGSTDEVAEKRVGPVGARAELGVELAGDKPGVPGELDYLNQPAVGRHTAENHSRFAERLTVLVIELESVTVALIHDLFPICLVRQRTWQ